MASSIRRISTHVLDIVRGKPAVDVPVRLELRQGERWRQLGAARTDQDGRCAQLLLESNDVSAGVYRLIFDTGAYFATQNIDSLYPAVEVTLQAKD
jgi:5-hydroxyisourate hydrolase